MVTGRGGVGGEKRVQEAEVLGSRGGGPAWRNGFPVLPFSVIQFINFWVGGELAQW